MSKHNLHNRKSNDGFRGLTHVVCVGDVVHDHKALTGNAKGEMQVQGFSVVSGVTVHEGQAFVTVTKLRADGSLGKRYYRSRVGCPGELGNNDQYMVCRQMKLNFA